MPVIRWRHLWREGDGSEVVELHDRRAVGRIRAPAGTEPFEIDYDVRWETDWRTRVLEYRLSPERRYMILFAADARWTVDGMRRVDLDGCLDVDLWPTPLTNTLAIRRILAEGRTEATSRVAWVDAFEGTVAAREQRYTRLAPDRWRFESLDDGFSAELVVDEEGFVVEYPGFFTRD